MLSATNYSVAQIASKVGYDSEQAFNRAFKRNFGNPPARYRNERKSRPDSTALAHTDTPPAPDFDDKPVQSLG
jgi:AraC-like DNA-binding protein